MWPQLLASIFGVIEKVIPDPQAQAAAKLEYLKLQATQEGAELEASMKLALGQLEVDKAEASSGDPLQHWRGGLGWVCTFGYAWAFVVRPIGQWALLLAGHPVDLPPVDIGQLATLTLGMLGLGGLHVAEQRGKS